MNSGSLQTDSYAGGLDAAWPDVDIVVLPGFPDDPAPIDGARDSAFHPSSATDVVKLLRAEGLDVVYAVERDDRQLMSKNAAEHWLPVVIAVSEFGANTLTSALASIVAEKVIGPFGHSSKLHVHCGIQSQDGSFRFFRGSGEAQAVVNAMAEFGKQ